MGLFQSQGRQFTLQVLKLLLDGIAIGFHFFNLLIDFCLFAFKVSQFSFQSFNRFLQICQLIRSNLTGLQIIQLIQIRQALGYLFCLQSDFLLC